MSVYREDADADAEKGQILSVSRGPYNQGNFRRDYLHACFG
jgi:hypothetical protein